MAGNKLGPRSKYVYESEADGVGFILTTDDDLAVAGTGVGPAAPVEYDPAAPPVGLDLCPAPRRFKPRVVFVEDPTDGARKELICFSKTADLYATNEQSAVTIDGIQFLTTGRKGEKLTF